MSRTTRPTRATEAALQHAPGPGRGGRGAPAARVQLFHHSSDEVIDNEHDDSANDCDDHAVQIEKRHAGMAGKLKQQPPTSAPPTPRTMSRTLTAPVRFTILLAIKPAISPRTIQPRTDISVPSIVVTTVYYFYNRPTRCRRGASVCGCEVLLICRRPYVAIGASPSSSVRQGSSHWPLSAWTRESAEAVSIQTGALSG